MNFLLYCLLFVPTIYSQLIEPKPAETKDPLSPSYNQPGLSPTYAPSTNNGIFGQTVPVASSYNTQPEVYPTYNSISYQPYPLQRNDENALVSTLGRVLPVLRQAFHLILRIAGKVALFLLGGAALLIVGGAFTAAVCYVTPVCTFSFMGYGLNQDQVRALLTPEKITMATNFVNEALDKYQKLQGVM